MLCVSAISFTRGALRADASRLFSGGAYVSYASPILISPIRFSLIVRNLAWDEPDRSYNDLKSWRMQTNILSDLDFTLTTDI